MLADLSSQVINLLVFAGLATTLLFIGRTPVRAQLKALRWQAFALAELALLIAFTRQEAEPFLAAVWVAAARGVAVPWLCRRLIARQGKPPVNRAVISPAVRLVSAAVLVVVAYIVLAPIADRARSATAPLLPSALAVVLIGILAMIAWRYGASRVLGLLVVANGSTLFGLLAAPGALGVIAPGLMLDLCVVVLLLGEIARPAPAHGGARAAPLSGQER
jgi:hydrogenase-4 membrane subunit HyfE